MNAHNEQHDPACIAAYEQLFQADSRDPSQTERLAVWARSWNAARAAWSSPVVKQNLTTQPAAAQEVVALKVWCGPMPESNGKQNWTVVLYRKGDPLFKGPHDCVYVSEYPDRARYEADRLRFIIGERADEPDITAYDSELHSGYAVPVAAAPAKVKALASTPAAPGIDLAEYDAGLLSDFGGGDIGWWQDYIRAELARAHEFYQSQIEASTKAAAPAIQVPAGWALVRTEPTVEMLDAGINEIDYDGNEVADNVRNVWLAMIEAARKDSPKGAASPEGGCNWPDCGHDTNGVGYSPGCTGIGCHKGSPKDGSEEAGLLSAAKDFYNCTVADPAVRISCSTKERRDRVKALGERLRDELKAAQAGDAEVQP